jgi:SAM-dependent methyltransferase
VVREAAVREYYEDVWEALPGELEPYEQRLRSEFLLAHVRPGTRALDLGAGEGAFTAELAAAGARPIGLDIAATAVARARALHPDLEFGLAPPDGPLPLGDAAVDLVWASEVIEHIADTERWLSEVRRVLAPEGTLLITTPFHGRLKNVAIALARFESHFDPVGQHLRFYTRRSLRALLERFDFDRVQLRAVGGPPLLRRMLLASARRPALGG